MDNTEMKKGEKIVGTTALFLAGAAIGAAAGVLLAPESGKETRRKVGQWVKEKSKKPQHLAEAIDAGRKAFREVDKKHLVGA